MSWFQIIATLITGALLLRAVVRFAWGAPPRGPALTASVVWFLSTLFILKPDLTMRVASWLGIGRGADLVLYVFVIFFIVAAFYFYGRFRVMESQMTTIVRHIALSNDATPANSEADDRDHPAKNEVGD